MIFKQEGARSFRTRMMYLSVDHEGDPTKRKGDILDEEIMPLLMKAPEMEAALRKIADGDFPDMPTMLDAFPAEAAPLLRVIRAVREAARRALATEKDVRVKLKKRPT